MIRMLPDPSPAPVLHVTGGYRALRKLTVAVRSQVDLGRVLDSLAADAGRFLDLSLCALARWEDAGRALVFAHEYRRNPDGTSPSLQGMRIVPNGDTSGGTPGSRLFHEHRAIVHLPAPEGGSDAGPGDALPDPLRVLTGSACVVIPIVADHRLVGVLAASRPSGLPRWPEAEVEFLHAAADLAAVAIQHAALRARMRILSATAAQLGAARTAAQVMRTLTEAAVGLTRSRAGLACLLEGEELVCREALRDGRWEPLQARFARETGLAGWSWAHRAPCIADGAEREPRAERALLAAWGIRSALAAPILDRGGDVLGVFEVFEKGGDAPYTEEDVHALATVAHHAALALRGLCG